MKEELYVIKDDRRLQLDLNSPSGITLNYVNNLFNDLSKINSSYTYTFNLPLTTNNRLVLDIVDDIRYNSASNKKKLVAEYRQNGVALFKSCNLYINAVQNGSISCCFTWGVLEGFDDLQKHDMPLNELEGSMYEWNSDYDFSHEKDDIIKIGIGKNDNKFDEYTEANLHKDIAFPYYVAGAECDSSILNYCKGIYPIFRDPYYTLTQAPYNLAIGYIPSSAEGEGVRPSPAPVIKVSKIVDKICERFNTNFAFGGGLYERLYMPIVSLNKSAGLLEQVYIKTDSHIAPKLESGTAVISATDAVLLMYPNNPNNDTTRLISNIGSTEGVMLHALEGLNPGYMIKSSDGYRYKLVLDGYVDIVYDHANTDTIDDPEFELRYFNAEYVKEAIVSVESKYSQEGGCYRCDFRKSKGHDNVETDYIDMVNVPVCFSVSVKDMSKSELMGRLGNVDLSHLKVYVKREAGDINYYTNLYKNLPDISCMEFVKSLYYVIGGFPYVDNGGHIGIKYYSDITKNILDKKYLNWSSKVLIKKDDNLDLNFFGEITSSMAQTNYYLMKNDDVNDYGAEKEYEYGEDRYEHSYCKVQIENENLEKYRTIIKLPFSGKFMANKSNIDWFTGRTTDLWKAEEYVSGGESANPMIGTLTLQETWLDASNENVDYDDPYDDRPTGSITNFSYLRGKMLTGFKVWKLPDDMANDNTYNALYAVFNKPYEIVEYMNLSEMDLLNFDYAVPVYIEKYNSYFMVAKIERTSDGISKVTLMRLDLSAIDFETYNNQEYDPKLVLKGDLICSINAQNPQSAYQSLYGALKDGVSTIYLDEPIGAYIRIHGMFRTNIYAFYGESQVKPDTTSTEWYVDGAETMSADFTLRAGMRLTCKVIATYKGKTATWYRSVILDSVRNCPGVVTNWALNCNRPYSLMYIKDGDTVKASELGVAYIKANVRNRSLNNTSYYAEVVIDGTREESLPEAYISYGKIMPKRNCVVVLKARAYKGAPDVISEIAFNYIYDIDEYKDAAITVGEAVWNSPHMESDNETL